MKCHRSLILTPQRKRKKKPNTALERMGGWPLRAIRLIALKLSSLTDSAAWSEVLDQSIN